MQAVHCYERAGLPREKDVAVVYCLREQARAKPVPRRGVDPIRAAAFIQAAEQFHQSATKATTRSEMRAYYRIAAECFAEAGDDRRAAKAYLDAMEYTRSAQYYRKAGLFDEAVEVVKKYSDEIPAPVAESIIMVAKMHYFREELLE